MVTTSMSLLSLTLTALLGATATTMALPNAGAAQEAEAEASIAPRPSGFAQKSGPSDSGGAKKKVRVIRLEELKVEGRIQKPQAFYLLQRSNLNFDDLNREESFLPKVVESVEKAPF